MCIITQIHPSISLGRASTQVLRSDCLCMQSDSVLLCFGIHLLCGCYLINDSALALHCRVVRATSAGPVNM